MACGYAGAGETRSYTCTAADGGAGVGADVHMYISDIHVHLAYMASEGRKNVVNIAPVWCRPQQ